MSTSRTPTSHIHGDHHSRYGCLPPPDAPETWGANWDQQLARVQAWQEAGGSAAMYAPLTIPRTAATTYPFVDRRKRALPIDFPDRRMAA